MAIDLASIREGLFPGFEFQYLGLAREVTRRALDDNQYKAALAGPLVDMPEPAAVTSEPSAPTSISWPPKVDLLLED